MPNNYDTRVGPGGGAQMYVNGQWLDENLFSPGTGLAGPLSPKQEANAGYAPGSAQSSNHPYLGETPDPGTNLYEPWRTPTRAAPTTGATPIAPVKTNTVTNNQGVKPVQPDGYGDLANMYGQQAKQKANAGYTGVAKSVTGAQGSALAAASAGGAIQNQQTSRVLAQNKPPTSKPIAKPSQPISAEVRPTNVTVPRETRPAAIAAGLLDQRREEQGGSNLKNNKWVSLGGGKWLNTETGEISNKPQYEERDTTTKSADRGGQRMTGIPVVDWALQNLEGLGKAVLKVGEAEKKVVDTAVKAGGKYLGAVTKNVKGAEQIRSVVVGEVGKFFYEQAAQNFGDLGKMFQYEQESRQSIKEDVIKVAKSYFDKPDFWSNLNMSLDDINALMDGDYNNISPEGKKIVSEASKAITEFADQSPEAIQESLIDFGKKMASSGGDTLGGLTSAYQNVTGGKPETNRYSVLAQQYADQRGAESGLQPDRTRDISEASGQVNYQGGVAVDANGNYTTEGTTTKAQLAEAARLTGRAIDLDSWPNVITERLTDELNWATIINPATGDYFKSAAEFLEAAQYTEDPNNPGLWQRMDDANPTIGGVYGGGYGYGGYRNAPYSYNGGGGGGWHDYGYGYSHQGGGGYGSNSNYGSPYGLINWRIG